MNEWLIKPSYKLDLACFCNLFLQDQMVIDRHKEGYESFQERIEARQDLISFCQNLLKQGLIIGCTAATVLSLVDYNGNDIDEICRILDDENMHIIIENYVKEQNFPLQIYEKLKSFIPVISDILHYIHNSGFQEYWTEQCLPAIQAKCHEFSERCDKYPVVSKVNELLGFNSVKEKYVTLYLSCFSAPYGIGLKNAFISDIRWNFENTVAIAVHEMIHPPFSREKIREITQVLWEDSFLQEAKNRLSSSSGYHLPEDFVEENLVEGTHIYLSEKLGVEPNPLKYLIDHDDGSHVLSVILYDALKKGYRERANTVQEVVEELIRDGSFMPGNIRNKYLEIYKEAGMQDEHPYL